MTEHERAADCDSAQAKMLQISIMRNGPSTGVRRKTDKVPDGICRNGTRWGYVKRAKVIGPVGWGRPKGSAL
jgi:hypothetical protein